MNWLFNYIYGSTPVEFESKLTLEESVLRLKKVILPTSPILFLFTIVNSPQAMGQVSAEHVHIQCMRFFGGGAFKPFFTGKFIKENNHLILKGNFAMALSARVALTFWFMGVIVFAIAAFVRYFTSSNTLDSLISVFCVSVLLLIFGFGSVAYGKWLSRNDLVWLSNIISTSLKDD